VLLVACLFYVALFLFSLFLYLFNILLSVRNKSFILSTNKKSKKKEEANKTNTMAAF